MTRESVDLGSIELPPVENRAPPANGIGYRPHAFDAPEEVPAFSPFGGEHVTQYTTSTHDQTGYLTADPDVIGGMIDHYVAKIEAAADDLALYDYDPQAGAETLVVSYGVISRSAKVAVGEARTKGAKVSSLRLRTLYPVPESAIRAALRGVSKVIVPEMNMGQYRLEIERLAPDGVQVVGVNKMDTTLISPAAILEEGGIA